MPKTTLDESIGCHLLKSVVEGGEKATRHSEQVQATLAKHHERYCARHAVRLSGLQHPVAVARTLLDFTRTAAALILAGEVNVLNTWSRMDGFYIEGMTKLS